jgi:hypothetical protein
MSPIGTLRQFPPLGNSDAIGGKADSAKADGSVSPMRLSRRPIRWGLDIEHITDGRKEAAREGAA